MVHRAAAVLKARTCTYQGSMEHTIMSQTVLLQTLAHILQELTKKACGQLSDSMKVVCRRTASSRSLALK